MATDEGQAVGHVGDYDLINCANGGNVCPKCIEMKTELLKLQDELKSVRLIVRLLEDERNNQLSDQGSSHNLANSEEEEANQSQPTSKEYDRAWKKVLNRKTIHNSQIKNPLTNKKQQTPVVLTMNSNEQRTDKQDGAVSGKIKVSSGFNSNYSKRHRIIIIGDSHVRGCSDKLANSLGKAFSVIGITKPNANVSAILHSTNLKNDKLSKRDVVIICGGSRDIAKNESVLGLRAISDFAKSLDNTNVILTTAPHRFDLLPSSCVNMEVEVFNRKLSKQLHFHEHVQLCSLSYSRDNFTAHGLHMNHKGKMWLTNKWTSMILAMVTRTQKKKSGYSRPMDYRRRSQRV